MARKKVKNKDKRTIYIIFAISILLTAAIFTKLPVTDIKLFSFGQGNSPVQFTPEPAKSNLQLYTFTVPTFTPIPNINSYVTPYPTIELIPVEEPTQANTSPINIPFAGQFPSGSQVGTSQQTAMIQGDISGEDTGCGIANSPVLQKGKEKSGKCCVRDGGVRDPAQCCSGVPYCDYTKNPPQGSGGINCGGTGGKPNLYWCNAKPVIYLYPKTKTTVSVKVKVPGTIPVSIPDYPVDGWKNIEAYPDGSLIYQGKKYNELFYESSITPVTPPHAGIIVPVENLQNSLTDITTRLGLKSNERQEFLAYWLPRLSSLKSPYVQVSVFSQESKELIDHVDIFPKPDTFIQFIMYYKGLQQPVPLKSLQLPETIPARIGFTAVEWGGIIDNN